MSEYLKRNLQWAKPQDSYHTQLDQENEQRFRNWLRLPQNQQRVGYFNPDNMQEDYDMRGWWLANKGVIAPQGHFPDTFKTPYHQTFSNESQYATPDAPKWVQQGKQWFLVDKTNNVLFSE